MKKYCFIIPAIMVFSLLSGFISKNLFPDHGMFCRDVKAVPINMTLVYANEEIKPNCSDVQEQIEGFRNMALEEEYAFHIVKVTANQIDLFTNSAIQFDCTVDAVFEGDSSLNHQNIIIRQAPFENIAYQDEASRKMVAQAYGELGADPDLVERIESNPVFYYNNKNVMLPEHTYLVILKSCKLTEHGKTYFIAMDYYDYADTVSQPVTEGGLGLYQDYADNEVFYAAQEDVDAYYNVKQQLLFMYP